MHGTAPHVHACIQAEETNWCKGGNEWVSQRPALALSPPDLQLAVVDLAGERVLQLGDDCEVMVHVRAVVAHQRGRADAAAGAVFNAATAARPAALAGDVERRAWHAGDIAAPLLSP